VLGQGEWYNLAMNDLDFVQACVSGDKQVWNEFMERYCRLIYKYIHSVLNAKGFSPAQDYIEDIFQELFHSLIQNDYKKLRSFKGKNGCSLASWLRQVTINLTLDYLRKIRPVASLDAELADDFTLKDVLSDNSASVADLLSYEEKLRSLQDCIQRLNNQEKYLIELNINQGIRLEVLREFFKLSRGAIDMQKARIIEKLRECFKSKGFKLDF